MLIDPGCLQEDAHWIVVCALRFLVHIETHAFSKIKLLVRLRTDLMDSLRLFPDGFVAVIVSHA